MADKVLIVDDDPAICKLLEKVMKSNELDPTIAMSGKEALNIIKNHTFDTILMDVMLGDMEGFEVIKKLRSQGVRLSVEETKIMIPCTVFLSVQTITLPNLFALWFLVLK